MNEDLKDTLNQTSDSWPAFYKKVEAIQDRTYALSEADSG
jgi:hypothetical protein